MNPENRGRGAHNKSWRGRGTRYEQPNEDTPQVFGGRGGRGGGRGRASSERGSWRLGGRPMVGNGDSNAQHHGNANRKEFKQRSYNLSYTRLSNLSQMENNNDVVRTLSNSDYNFETFIQDFMRDDLFFLVIKVLAKVCESDFKEDKIKIIKAACSSHKFIEQFPSKISEAESRPPNEIKELFHNVVIFFEAAAQLLPMICSIHISTMKSSMYSMIGLNAAKNLGFEQDGCFKSFNDIIASVALASEEARQPQKSRTEMWKERQGRMHDDLPPNDFRQLTIFPTPEEILSPDRPYLRINLVDKAYTNVDHYLDVQFRLMKEDYVRPLREGIIAFKSHDPAKIKEASVRQYEHIEFVRDSSPKIPAALTKKKKRDVEGVLVNLNFQRNKSLKKMEWKFCKRLMFGSLVCFTTDEYQTIHLATVVDRDMDYLAAGFFKIEFCEHPSINIYASSFKMIESEVFFDPYNHVLRTLQTLDETNFPFAEYIITYQKDVYPPKYLEVEPPIIYKLPQCQYPVLPLDTKTWPSQRDLDLDDSQYRALYMGLTRELAVIQGPPGTGKTFIGLKIAEILVQNREASKRLTPILVVCLTNHALDQFLVGISKFTSNIVRIGGQSKCEDMDRFNLRVLRRHSRLASSRFANAKRELEANQRQLAEIDTSLKELGRGILTLDCLVQKGRAASQLFYNDTQLLMWLFGAPLEALKTPVGRTSFSLTIYDLESKMEDLAAATSNDPKQQHERNKELRILDNAIALLKEKLENAQPADRNQAKNWSQKRDTLSLENRWRLYMHWCKNVEDTLLQEIVNFQVDIASLQKQMGELQEVEDLEILRGAEVVGLTTSGAARLHGLMKDLGAEIVIVEEAAEVMETHVVACLTLSCVHLILIGDHKQLRPSVAVYQLAKDYNFDISLFERMVNRAEDQCVTLGVQHRMAPAIASLITPAIYKNLKNADNVKRYDEIKGCPNRVYFIDHRHHETHTDLDSHSRINSFEADYLMNLCRHLLLQGYTPDQITILTTYRGQMFHIKKEKSTRFPDLENVLVTVVDNYQGEENDIILLSLVRSNESNSIGFLKMENRVNVALSRAKYGLYIVGNMSCLAADGNGTIWKSISKSLSKINSIGPGLPLRCQNHLEMTSIVKCAADFSKVSPQGGCTLSCNVPLECKHNCQALCHIQRRDHKDMKCMAKCERPCAHAVHKCQKKCYEECGDCTVPVTLLLQPCNHTLTIPCYANKSDLACKEIVEKLFPKCGHKSMVECHVDPMRAMCKQKCDRRLECGHKCENKCHMDSDPDHLRAICSKVCNKINIGCSTGEHRCGKMCKEECQSCSVYVLKKRSCGHEVRVMCSEDAEAVGKCNKKCTLTLPCGHKCNKSCMQNCFPCPEPVVVEHPDCGHQVSKLCGQDFLDIICTSKCSKILTCGHPCADLCGTECSSSKCCQPIGMVPAECGHRVELYCKEYRAGLRKPMSLLRCKIPCGAQLHCGHTCPGTCGTCFQGRFHQVCNQPCGRNLICNHTCKEMCATSCPPCPEKCIFRCEHSKCPKNCGEPCMPCKERCSNGCRHKRCSRTCGDKCDIEPCKEPCTKKLKCDHPCVGMCGDICPPLCRICNKEELTEIFFGDEDEEDARFIYLQECNHCIEIEAMDKYMSEVETSKGGDLAIKAKECPRCKARVTSQRYGNIIKECLANVNQVKRHCFGTSKDNEIKRSRLIHTVEDLINADPEMKRGYPELYFCLDELIRVMQPVIDDRKNVLHAFDLLAREIEVDILGIICKIWAKGHIDDLKESIDFLLQVFETKKRRISQQQVVDFTPELQRLQYTQQLLNYKTQISFYPRLAELVKEGLEIDKIKRFDENSEARVNAILVKAKAMCINAPGLGITEVERIQIVQAIGLTPGHWFKCPNGHVYAIADCGGAVMESRCGECGSAIGGANHRLRSDNTFFTGMDNARHPAWSEQANMGNYGGL